MANIMRLGSSAGGNPSVVGGATGTDDASYAGFTHYTPSVDLGAAKKIIGGTLMSFRYGQTGPTGETIFCQGSNDNTSWTTIDTENLPNDAGTYVYRRDYKLFTGLNVSYRYVRYGVTRSWQGTGGHMSTVAGTVTIG